MNLLKRNTKNRTGASTVEFAIVAPIFLLTIFACIEFSKFWMAETFVESAVFNTARDVSVFGAQIDEGRPFAEEILGRFGIEDFTIDVVPFQGPVVQPEITDTTTEIEVTINVPASEISIFNGWLSNTPIIRTAESRVNRPN